MPKIAKRARALIARIKTWATEYEPARAAAAVAAGFQIAALLGIKVGDLPTTADNVLAAVAVLATLIQGRYVRGKVYAPATVAQIHATVAESIPARRLARGGLVADRGLLVGGPEGTEVTFPLPHQGCDECGAPATHTSAGGFRWCVEHAPRGRSTFL